MINNFVSSSVILRRPQVTAMTGIPRSTLYNLIKHGLWTSPVRLGSLRSVGWPEKEVALLNKAHIAGEKEEKLRKLVQELETARTTEWRVMSSDLSSSGVDYDA